MLKGHVFSRQLFGNPIFALFINTFLNGKNGISNNYKNGMALSYSGSTVTVQSGAVCIQGRFLEEDTSTPISAGTDNAYCKLVVEIDLDKQNTEADFQQGSYKIIKGASSYPNLTQTNIVKNNAGVYQYELARFRTNANGISDFQDMRTFLDFDSIYDEIEAHIEAIDAGSVHVKKSGDTMTGKLYANGGIQGNVEGNVTGNVTGNVSGSSGSCSGNSGTATKLKTARTINGTSFDGSANITTTKWGTARTLGLSGAVSGSASVDGSGNVTITTTQANITTITGSMNIAANSGVTKNISYPTGYTKDNSVPISLGIKIIENKGYNYEGTFTDSGSLLSNAYERRLNLGGTIDLYVKNPNTDDAKTVYYKIVLMKVS